MSCGCKRYSKPRCGLHGQFGSNVHGGLLGSERVFDTEQRCQFVTKAVVVEFDQQVEMDEKVTRGVHLHPGGSRRLVVGLILEGDVCKSGSRGIEPRESLRRQSRDVEHPQTEDIERPP